MEHAPLHLKRNEERRLRAGHLWVYSNEIDTNRTPLSSYTAGQSVNVIANDGKAIGSAYINPNNLICARLYSRSADAPLDRSLLVHRINMALSLRQRLFERPYYRLVYGEADLLPGVVVDRYGDILVVQITTAGMEQAREALIEALHKVLKPQAILLRNDSSARQQEGLDQGQELLFGELPEWVALEENGVRFEAPLQGGQKTGWFYDHRPNRAVAASFSKGKRVLDLFSYIGGWGVQCAAAGASGLVAIDSSAVALDGVERNARLNGVEDKVSTLQGDVFEALKALRADNERFDIVIADPPAFIKRKKDVKNGLEAYRRLNQQAMQLLGKDGILVSASCSHNLLEERLLGEVWNAARHIDRHYQLIGRGHQGGDHPIHPAIPESEYIKCLFGRVYLI